MRPDIRRWATPTTRSWRGTQAPDAITLEESSAEAFNDRQTSEILTAFLRAHGTPTSTTTILHNGALTQSVGSRHKGSRVT